MDLPKYKKIIKKPMYLSLIEQSVNSNTNYNYSAFCGDIQLMFDNCKTFNKGDQYEKVNERSIRSSKVVDSWFKWNPIVC